MKFYSEWDVEKKLWAIVCADHGVYWHTWIKKNCIAELIAFVNKCLERKEIT